MGERDEAEIIDISPVVEPSSPVWPGDSAFEQSLGWSIEDGGAVNVNRMSTTPHIGAHADAPLHVSAGGPAIGAVSLEPYLGVADVVHCLGPEGITIRAVRAALERAGGGPVAPRLLIRSYRVAPIVWDDMFHGIDVEVVRWFAAQGGRLLGLDQASFDPMASTTMDAHHAAFSAGMAVLENLVLDHVVEGRYELIALPLRLRDMDASPVRAVLRRYPSPPSSSSPTVTEK